jgi:hypothetical protein
VVAGLSEAGPESQRPRLELTDLELGATYLFQIATAGGIGGQSYGSPELRRTIG